MNRNGEKAGVESRVCQEAELWLVRLMDLDDDAPERAEFERWCAVNPLHTTAYREAERVWALGKEVAQHPAIVRAANQALRETAAVGSRPRHNRLVPALAVALTLIVLAIAGSSWWYFAAFHQWQARYSTTIGRQRTVELKDGSSVLLDTDSAVTVRYTRRTRRVNLVRGRAEFHDRHSLGRPFIVHAGTGTVIAVGTTFQVSVGTRGDVDVTLIEGKVSVDAALSRATLTKGEALRYGATGILRAAHPADLSAALGWTHGEVVAHDWRLPRLLAEMNRYSETKLQIADPALRKVRISGTFSIGDQQTLEKVLRAGWSIRTTRKSPREVLLSRK